MSRESWLVIGLGNPGKEYESTRHNVGFMVIDRLALRLGISVKRNECRALIGQTVFREQKIELVKPLTFMNLSGESVNCLLQKEPRRLPRVVTIVDELALPVGSLRIRPKGSAGGHNGLKSIIANVRTDEFIRIRIGIAPEHKIENTSKFVLDRFSSSEMKLIDDSIEQACDAIEVLVEKGVDIAMSQFN